MSEQIADCIFSEDRLYRYNWTRRISDKPGRCLFIALNPSKADEYRSDNTVTRGCKIVDAWDIGVFEMGNLFAYRATNPADMKAATDPVGPENDRFLREAIRRNPLIVVCWGVHGDFMDRDHEVLRLIEYEGKRPMCLGTTLAGFPRHPSRLGYGVPPSIYYGRSE